MSPNKRAVGVFAKIEDAVIALEDLKATGFPIEKVSVIARDTEDTEKIIGTPVTNQSGTQAEESVALGTFTGVTLGTLAGLLVGLGILAIPGVGPIMLAGAQATALATTLAGSAIGAAAGTVVGGLVGLGIPEEEAKAYYERLSRGAYLVMVEGTDEELVLASRIMTQSKIEDWVVYEAHMKQMTGVTSDNLVSL